jgi:hypothetical protein
VQRGLDDGLSKAFELALTPAVLGVLGWLVDRELELTPLFTLIAFFLGVIGTSLSAWYRYDAAMRQQERVASEARAARPPRPRRTSVVDVEDLVEAEVPS